MSMIAIRSDAAAATGAADGASPRRNSESVGITVASD